MRIITGSARGCRLQTPTGMSTRPTADRVKESIFNILGNLAGCSVLDIFAGTGNLGLEALSRGAAKAVFLDKATVHLIQANAERTHLSESALVMGGDALVSLSRLQAAGEKFNLVFCDPPYRQGLWEKALSFLDGSVLLLPQALVVVEQGVDEKDIASLSQLSLVRQKKYGATTKVSFFRSNTEEKEVF